MSDKPDLNALLGGPQESRLDLMNDEFPEQPLPTNPTNPDDFSLSGAQASEDHIDPATRQQRPLPQQSEESVESADLDAETTEIMAELIEERRQARVCTRFIERHAADYTPSPGSWAVMESVMQQHNIPLTELGLERAFSIASGNAPNAPVPPQQQQPVKPAKRVETGLSDRPGESGPRGEESLTSMAIALQNLPIDQARLKMQQLMNAAAAKNRR